MRGIARRSWATKGIGAAGIAGLAVVAAVVMLSWSSAPTGQGVPGVHAADDTATPTVTATPVTPTATPTVNPNCDLSVSKSDSPDPVAEGGQITYTIKVTNDGDGTHCDDLTVKDVIPDNTTCVSEVVASSSDIDDSDFDVTHDCPRDSGTVTWKTDTDLNAGDQVVITMVVELTSDASDGDKITNEACATSTNDVQGDCDTEKTEVSGVAATSTPLPTATTVAVAPTATVRAIVPPPVVPTAAVAPLAIPNTGSGPGSSGNSALALALGLTGGALLLLGGTGVWLRRRS